MDNKKKSSNLPKEDLKGFEEFIEDHQVEGQIQRPLKNEGGFESYNFLEKDSHRLAKIKNLMSQKLPFMTSHDQSEALLHEQQIEIETLKIHLNNIFKHQSSGYRKSLSEIFDSFFGPTKS